MATRRGKSKASKIQARHTRKLTASAFVVGSGPGSYTTVGNGARSRQMHSSNYGPSAVLDNAAITLRNQSRQAVRSSSTASAAIDKLVTAVIGTGIKPKLPVSMRDLWNRWTDECSVDGINDFYGMQAQGVRAMYEAGECFALRCTPDLDENLSVPVQFQLLEAEFVPIELNKTLPDGNFIRQGIEFSARNPNKRVAYWIYPFHPAEPVPQGMINEPVRVKARDVTHIFEQLRPGQQRGEPLLAGVLGLLNDVENYEDAELMRKKTAALFAGFVRRAAGVDATLKDLQEEWGDDSEEEGGVGVVNLEPGTMQLLQPGEDVEFTNPSDTSGALEVYIRLCNRKIAAAVGLLYESLTGDYSQVNDRTWRAAIGEFRRSVEMIQHQIVVKLFCVWAYKHWIDACVLAGIEIDEDYVPLWVPQRWDYINPKQDIEALNLEIRSGLTSRSDVVDARGHDAAVIDAQQAADNARADSLGVKYDSDGRFKANENAPQFAEKEPEPTEPKVPPNN